MGGDGRGVSLPILFFFFFGSGIGAGKGGKVDGQIGAVGGCRRAFIHSFINRDHDSTDLVRRLVIGMV